MKLAPKFLIAALLAWNTTHCVAQTADRITYDIIYDVSGSVPIFDNNHNLTALFQKMVQVTGDKKQPINSYADFKIYFIGGDASAILGKNSYLSINSSDAKLSGDILAAFKKQVDGSRKQQFTYLHTALDEIIKANKPENNKDAGKVAGGVFIFSDAQIGEKDFEAKAGDPLLMDRAHYLAGINLKIATIEQTLHKPVFIIQSYLLPQNEFAIIPDSSKFPNTNKDLVTTSNWFWVKNSTIADTSKRVKAAFENFIDQANIKIVSANQLIPKNDKVATSIKLEQIFNQAKNLDQHTLAAFLKNAFPSTMTQAQQTAVQNIVKLAGASSYTDDDIKKLQESIKLLAQAPEILRELQTQVATNIGTQLALTSDQSLASATLPAVKADVTAVKIGSGETMQSMILNGIAKYLVNRVKEEIALYFIDQVNRQSLNHPYKYREIGIFLLPNTKMIISNPENYSDINSLKTAFLKDIDQLPDNLASHSDIFGHSEGLVALQYFYQLYNNIRQTTSLEISFENLAKTIEARIKTAPTMVNTGPEGLGSRVSKIEQSILFTSRLVGYLRTHDLSKIYLNQQPDTLTKILTLLSVDGTYIKSIHDLDKLGPVINTIYLKYQDLKNTVKKYQPILTAAATGHVQDFNTDQLAAVNDILSKISDLMLSGAPILDLMKFDGEEVTSVIPRLQQQIKDFTNNMKVKVNQVDYNFKFTKTDKAVSVVIADGTNPALTLTSTTITKDYQPITLNNVQYYIHLLNYADIALPDAKLNFALEPVTNALNAQFDNGSVIRSAENTLQAYFLFRQHKYADAVNLILPDLNLALRDRFGSDTLVLEQINKVFRIAGGVVAATSSEDIENIIAKNAVPAGSYKDKRNSRETFYLNAYAGAAVTDYTANGQITAALFAPIGFEYAFGRKGGAKHCYSLGILLNVLDVGNIINYQLANNGSDQNDVTSLSRAFAPGLYLTYGMSNHHPLSLIGGYQMNPGRLNIGIAFDLPIFPIIQKK